jgi:chemosensory pili system protein ChpA (sensor histidine kinase/response regulator)
MTDNRNFAALDWLVHEISETLKEARQSLETFVENPNDVTRLRFCLTHIHQVHGSLQMVEFYGAAMLASEMEQLTQAMITGAVSNNSEAQEVLMRSILQFPLYLDQVKASRKDNPLIVLPLLNDLRAVRGESLLTDTKLFVPNLAPAKKISGARLPVTNDNVQFQAMALKLRQMYQYAASGFIRGVNPEENLAYLEKAVVRLQKLCHGTARFALWDICVALVEAIQLDALEISVAVKNLLRQLDKEIKLLAVHGIKSLNSFTNDELIKNLLYYIARAGKHLNSFPPNSHLEKLYKLYQLEDALLEGKESTGGSQTMAAMPDAEAIRSVVIALKDELELIKKNLDFSIASQANISDQDSPTAIADSVPVIKRVANTLAVLGLGELRKQVLEQGAVLEHATENNIALSNDHLLSIASHIIAIENALEQLSEPTNQEKKNLEESDFNLARAKDSVLRESRNGLEHAKDAIIEYIASQWNREYLQSVPTTLREIRGGLEIMPLPRPARILGACARYIDEQLLVLQGAPQWSNLDTLADAITSVEYYLERLSAGGRKEEIDLLLAVAEESVASLGYAVAKVSKFAAEEAPVIVQAPPQEEPLQDMPLNEEAVLEEIKTHEISEEITEEETIEELIAAEVEEIEVEEPVVQQAPEKELIATSNAPVIDRDSEDIDDEIIEIFIEEAGEVTETINEFFPRWAQNFNDKEALTEFRRAFHTLKGSGRMVGANEIGELAWSIENMLNRIIDHTIHAQAMHVQTIQNVRSLLPDMIAAFRDNIPNPHAMIAETYRQQALSLAQGIIPAGLTVEDSFTHAGIPTTPPVTLIEEEPEEEAEEDVYIDDEIVEEIREETLEETDEDLLEEAYEETLEETAEAVVEEFAPEEIVAIEEENVIEETVAVEDDPDAQLWDIFGAEAITHLQTVTEFVASMEANAPLYEPPSEELQRALHTLKGSAHMAEVTPVAELAAPMERFIKELRSYHVSVNEDILQLLRDAVSYTEIALLQIKENHPVEIPRLQQFLARVHELREIHVEPLARQREIEKSGKQVVDPQLLAVFMAEDMNLLLNADQIINQWQANPSETSRLILVKDELTALTKAAAHAYFPNMAELSDKLSNAYEEILAGRLDSNPFVCDNLQTAHHALLDMVDAVAAGQNLNHFSRDAHSLLDMLLSSSAENESITLTDMPVMEVVEEPVVYEEPIVYEEPTVYEEIIHEEIVPEELIIDVPEEELIIDASEEELIIDVPEIEAIEIKIEETEIEDEPSLFNDVLEHTQTHEHEHKYEEDTASTKSALGDDNIDPEIVEIFVEEAGELLEDIDRALNDWEEDWNNEEPAEDLKRSLHTFKGGARLAGIMSLGDLSHDFETMIIDFSRGGDLDQAFFARMHAYQDNMHAGVERIRARLSGAPLPDITAAPIPTSTHSVESQETETEAEEFEVNTETDNKPTFTRPSIVVDNTRSQPSLSETETAVVSSNPNVIPFMPPAKTGSGAGSESGGGAVRTGTGGPGAQVQHLAARRSGPQEVVKVSAELLEELVNLAGETSISRGRMEQQVSDLGTSIEEMDATIHRLQEQLRRLDIETEAQVLFSQEQMAQHEDFDPLEMDRYSQMQTLSRSLIESASDLMDLKYTLNDKIRDTETLLLQQSRINTDLQEGLMRSRMVPFSRLVPRLRRIVRQAATELNKDVDLELDNVEGELDRTMLERMLAPLEHMLRNAVDHGIETPEERQAAGKPANGRILLTLGREGGDVLLRLVDDGRGINLKRVREKAIERGMMTPDAKLSDQEIIQFILSAGFSTAEKVTQISGRGVGMDVVHSEIKQLGGSMIINSQWGQGTEFIIRLPFTVSVNRALMIQLGDDLYALPLNTIEGIVRVSPFELEHYYQDEDARFEYAGEQYQVRYLGSMMDTGVHPKLDGQSLPLPVILVRSAEHSVALQVDRLLSSREIAVKTLGVQFSAVHGVSGATVMGDGSVVVILDLHAMIRELMILGVKQTYSIESGAIVAPIVEEELREKVVMVVDDSVTVRKVTSRFLEREGFRVITAKDGVEALQVLQDHMPDVMLLDIEMPRMDGFEVAQNVRNSARLKHLPIIMITSRTGEKHRERAFDLGVDMYMGKPYQEDMLLTNINELLNKTKK